MKNLNVVFFMLLLMATSCVPYKKALDASQQAYNLAVEKQNSWITKELEKDAPDFSNSPAASDFESTYSGVNNVISEFGDKMKADGVFGTAMTLKAMCEYNMGKNNDAVSTADEALSYINASENGEISRDKALMASMKGLVKANQLMEMLPSGDGKVSAADYTKISDLAKSALADINEGRKTVSPTHPVQGYLIQQQLAINKNLLNVLFDTVDMNSSDEELKIKREREDSVMSQCEGLLTQFTNAVGSDGASLVDYWKKIIGL